MSDCITIKGINEPLYSIRMADNLSFVLSDELPIILRVLLPFRSDTRIYPANAAGFSEIKIAIFILLLGY